MVKVIIFDLGQVVIKFDLQVGLHCLLEVCNASLEDVATFFTKSEPERLFTEGKISSEKFFHEVRTRFNLSIDFNEFCTRYNTIFEVNEPIATIITCLKKHYRVATISNTNELHFNYLMERYPIMKMFDEYIVSFKEKCQKPSYKIFEHALIRLDVAPTNVVFIDDMEKNVIAAGQIGMRSIHYTNPEELVEKLRKYGVKV